MQNGHGGRPPHISLTGENPCYMIGYWKPLHTGFQFKRSPYIIQNKDVFPMHITKKKILTILLFFLVVLLAAAGISSTSFQGGVPVLNYHQINDRDHNALTLSTPEFEAQMKYLAENGYHTITADELADHLENGAALPEKPILLTFDDGYIDNYENAYPILKKYNLKGSIFIITDYLNVYPNYLTWEIAREMQDSGVIDIQCHTMTHVALSSLNSAEELQHEAVDSKKAIETHLEKRVTSIAYPCGAYNDEVQSVVKEAGYRTAFTVNYGLDNRGDDQYALDRIPIFGSNSHSFLRFKLRLLFTPLFSRLQSLRTELLSSGHDMCARFILVP